MPRTVIVALDGQQAEIAEGQEKIWQAKGYKVIGYRREDGAPIDKAEKPVEKEAIQVPKPESKSESKPEKVPAPKKSR